MVDQETVGGYNVSNISEITSTSQVPDLQGRLPLRHGFMNPMGEGRDGKLPTLPWANVVKRSDNDDSLAKALRCLNSHEFGRSL